ncbi:BA14K-like protein [Methyloligella halotolerans]|uniref:Lectin-like protein BA14k n=1 Tax=Methyloligella halotolerans TaxID=1177755 RepID=A0A1E2RXM2_9HYPH|nr:BA14K family protein [Methyloligella halotolerans]ODA66971.1 BA14K-like protein [Methyloligella halotolerans]
MPASAGDRYYHGRSYDRGYERGYRQGKYNYKNNNGDALAAGAIGLGLGAIIGSAAASAPPPPPAYYSGPAYYGPVDYAPPAWSPDWYAYCSSRFGSFNPRTGYYMGYDGRPHFCY